MCFSMQADFIAGVLVLPVGVLSLRTARGAREVAFAALPILFGLHQLVEVLVWDGASAYVSSAFAHAAAVAYVVFAVPVLPTLIPVAVLLLEPPGRRSRILPFVLLGVVVSAYFTWTILEAFTSLWCIWAAVTSVLVLLHLHRRRTHHLEQHEPEPTGLLV